MVEKGSIGSRTIPCCKIVNYNLCCVQNNKKGLFLVFVSSLGKHITTENVFLISFVLCNNFKNCYNQIASSSTFNIFICMWNVKVATRKYFDIIPVYSYKRTQAQLRAKCKHVVHWTPYFKIIATMFQKVNQGESSCISLLRY